MGHMSLISRLGRSPGVGNGNLLQSSCLENPLDRGAWWAAVHRVTKIRTRLSAHTTIYFTVSQKLCSSFLNLNQLNNCDELPTGGSEVKASAWNAGDPGSVPGLGRSPGEGNGNPLQYSCLENPMEGGAW